LIKKSVSGTGEVVLENDGYFLLGYNEKIIGNYFGRVYLELERTKGFYTG